MVMEKERIMLDQSRVGTKLENKDRGDSVGGSVVATEAEARAIRGILNAATGRDIQTGSNEFTVTVRSRGVMRVTLRRHKHNTDQWYLNLDGNPLTFLTGRNVYGFVRNRRVPQQIVSTFKRCLKAIEKQAEEKTRKKWEFPARIREEIEKLNISLNHLEFASYTGRLADKRKILNAWRYMFGRATSKKDGSDYNRTLAEMLGVQIFSGHADSFSVATVNKRNRKKVMFCAYDKQKQLEDEEEKGGDGVIIDVKADEWTGAMVYREDAIPDDIKDRLRLEIGFTSIWFDDNHVKTLADMVAYVEKKHEGDWVDFVRTQTYAIMKKARLIDMWSFDGETVMKAAEKKQATIPDLDPKLPTYVWLSMLEARAEIDLTTPEMQLKKLKGDPEYTKALIAARKALPLSELKKLSTDTSLPVIQMAEAE